eukprot:m51a1_g9672 putative acetylornithine deacetylase-like (421) ;mRNA; f:1266949-1268907
MKFERVEFVGLLGKMVAEAKALQSDTRRGLVAQEERVARLILGVLEPHATAAGGPLVIERVCFVDRRPNIIVTYPARDPSCTKTVAFAGVHMDVVPADPKAWSTNPFELVVDGDRLVGRGVTDCLGHCALVTLLMEALAKERPALDASVVAVFIADEESPSGKAGAEMLLSHGHFDRLKNGPVFWIDCADKQPCVGSGGIAVWELMATGKAFHSGMPNRGVNAVELASDAVAHLQAKFYARYGPHELEPVYGFECSSSMKPTDVCCEPSGMNQLPGWCRISGDIRLLPFYKVADVIAEVDAWARELSGPGLRVLEGRRGGGSVYHRPGLEGRVALRWLGPQVDGLACDLKSAGHRALCDAVKEVVGFVKPTADTGTLPIVADLSAMGIDVQTIGADNEYGLLSDFEQGFQILSRIIAKLC